MGWEYNCGTDKCSLCCKNIHDICIFCSSGGYKGDGCTLAWRPCNHQFHFHCISRHLKFRGTCPKCNKEQRMGISNS